MSVTSRIRPMGIFIFVLDRTPPRITIVVNSTSSTPIGVNENSQKLRESDREDKHATHPNTNKNEIQGEEIHEISRIFPEIIF